MTANNFKKLMENKKHAIVNKIVIGELKINCKDKGKSLTKKQYKKILSMDD